MNLHLLYEHSNQLSVSLTVRNVSPWDDEWIVALMANDVQSLQAMLQVSPSRINDFDQAGESAIEVRFAVLYLSFTNISGTQHKARKSVLYLSNTACIRGFFQS